MKEKSDEKWQSFCSLVKNDKSDEKFTGDDRESWFRFEKLNEQICWGGGGLVIKIDVIYMN
jgi:hypothetical protein